MWILYASLSAVFAGLTAILAKIGVKNVNSNLATAIRTIVVLIFTWLMVFVVGSQNTIGSISGKTLLFLVLSGFATGASWLCYFKALQLGDVNKVTPIDKSSTIMTIILAIIVFGEGISISKGIGVVLLTIGTYMMIDRKPPVKDVKQNYAWLVYAFLAAIFAALVAILGKIGIEGVESNLGTAIRTVVVLIMAWLVVGVTGDGKDMKNIDRHSLLFLCLSGLATGLSWLCYFRALQDGPASIVVPIDKLSIVLTIFFSYVVLKEKLSKKSFAGLMLIVFGTIMLLIKQF